MNHNTQFSHKFNINLRIINTPIIHRLNCFFNMIKFSFILTALTLTIFGTSVLSAAASSPQKNPRRILVQWDAAASDTQRDDSLNKMNGKLVKVLHTDQMQKHNKGKMDVIEPPAGMTVDQAVQFYKTQSGVKFAQPERIFQLKSINTPNDPLYPDQWNLNGPFGSNPGALWNLGIVGSASIIVGIIDSGIQHTHPDLAANMNTDLSYDFINNRQEVYNNADEDTHGTEVASIIGAVGNNDTMIAGTNWNVQMISIKVCVPAGCDEATIIEGIDYLTTLKETHPTIIASNNSYGAQGPCDQALSDAVGRAQAAGIIFVAAAGNDSTSIFSDSPANCPSGNVIAVGSINSDGSLSDFSDFGTWVHLGAPGGFHLDANGVITDPPAMLALIPDGISSNDFVGTSAAAPHVTGAAALLKAYSPSSTWDQIRTSIINGTIPTPSLGNGNTLSGGRLDIGSAAAYLSLAPQIVVEPISLLTSKDGAAASFQVSLNKQPAQDVSTPINGNPNEGIISPPSLVFTTNNWSEPQTVNVTGVEDFLPGDQLYSINIGPSASTDPQFNNLNAVMISVTNLSNNKNIYTASSSGFVNTTKYTTNPSSQGALQDTYRNDGVFLTLTEGLSNKNLVSVLNSYQFLFNNVVNANRFMFTGYRTANNENDNFRLDYSTDNGATWKALTTVKNTTNQTFVVDFGTSLISGNILVRALDTNRTSGSTFKDSLFIDQIIFQDSINENAVFTAQSETTVSGNLNGTNYTATAALDGNAEMITEVLSGGKYILNNKWDFGTVLNANNFIINATASEPVLFQYSVDKGKTWINLVTIDCCTGSYEINLPIPLNAASVLLKATDTNRTNKDKTADTLSIDFMGFSH